MGPVEFALKIYPFDDNLPNEVKKLQAEGWQGVQGLVPAVTYVMWRAVQQPTSEGRGGITVDDSKVEIIRGNGRT